MNIAKLLLCVAAVAACLLLISRSTQAAPPAPAIAHAASASRGVPPLRVTPRMRRYARTGYALYFAGTAYELLLLWGILQSGLSARLDAQAQQMWRRMLPAQYRLRRWSRRQRRRLSPQGQRLWIIFLYGPRCLWRHSLFWGRRLVTALVYGVLLTLLLAAAHLPLVWYGSYTLQHQYGLSRQSVGGWLSDYGTGLALDLLSGIAYFVLLWLVRKSPRRWSAWLWAVSVPIIAFGIFLSPVLFDPIYNKFTPLPNGPLRTHLEQLAAKAGIPNAPISVSDQSRRTTTDNAYVTGLGGTARIVIWDTTLKDLDDREVAGVVAHEMGHYALHHVRRGFWETVSGLLVALPLLQWGVTVLWKRCGPRWRVARLTDLSAVPVFLLVLAALTFFSEPITNYFSRQIEHQADAYGLALSGDGPAMARAFVFFASHDLDDPAPPRPIKLWLFSHPPLGERIDFVLGRKSAPAHGT